MEKEQAGGKEGKCGGWGEDGQEERKEKWEWVREQGEGPVRKVRQAAFIFRLLSSGKLRLDQRCGYFFEGLLTSLLEMDLWEGCASDSVF